MLLKHRSEKAEELRKVPLFKSLSQRHLSLIAQHADQVERDAGKVLVRQGEMGREFVMLLDGEARVERDGQFLARLSPGDFFGEMSLIDGKPRTATVIAETPVVLLVVERRSFTYLLDEIPALTKKLLVTVVERLRNLEETLIG